MKDFRDRNDRSVEEIKKELEALGSYDLTTVNDLSEMGGVGFVLSHKKTKARISVVVNDDDNKVFAIGFRTPPTNSKGIQHIVEHTVLCGSKKYPAKDPFIELAKGSLNTFLNAMTFSDKTVYPVASCNDKDLRNLMDVYLDAVFNPNIYSREEIFKQEGWHYEMADKDSDLTINGVVYNEMRGVYSSPDSVLANLINTKMYPDSVYGVDSGGDPDIIPELTREEYLDYHKNYYHPSNSYIYLYGDVDIVEQLSYLDMEYLKDYDYLYVPSEIKLQDSFDAPVRFVDGYSAAEGEDLEKSSILSYNVVTGRSTDKNTALAMSILQYILVDAPGAPLKKTIVDSGICSDVESQYDNTMLQPLFTILARDAKTEDLDTFTEMIEKELKGYVSDGLDKEAIEAALNRFEFRHKEAAFGRYPKGLTYGINDFEGWLYDDSLAQCTFEMQSAFDHLREGINNGYFEELIQKYILDNNHKSFIAVEPVVGLNDKKDAELAEKLKAYKESLSDEEIERIVSETEHLKAYQSEPSTQEELESIPLLSIEDIDPKIKNVVNRETVISGANAVAHDLFTNGITYLDLYFCLNDFDFEELGKLELIMELLKYVDTDEHTYGDLRKQIDLKTGGIAFILGCMNRKGKDPYIYAKCQMKTFDGHVEDGIGLIKEIITTSHITDKKRIKEILSELKSSGKISLVEGGHLTARMRAGSYIDPVGRVMDSVDGVDFYRYVNYLDTHFDEVYDELAKDLERLYKKMFRKSSLLISYTSDKGDKQLEKPISDLMLSLSDEEFTDKTMQIPLEIKNEGFKTGSKVQYVGIAGDFSKEGLDYTGCLNVLKVIMSYDYLWTNVRVLGGAYGAMCDFTRFGMAYFISYRDPHLKNTYEVFRNAAKYVEEFNCSDRDMTKYIIGTISNVDMPMTPSMVGTFSFTIYMSGVTEEERQKNRDQILSATPDDIKKLAPYVRAISDSEAICTVGGEEKLNESRDIFKSIENIY